MTMIYDCHKRLVQVCVCVCVCVLVSVVNRGSYMHGMFGWYGAYEPRNKGNYSLLGIGV